MTGDADVVSALLIKYLRAYGVEESKEVVFLADGAHWIWSRIANIKNDLQFEKLGIKSILAATSKNSGS